MKILFLNTFEDKGGASIAADRLLHALNRKGIEVTMLVLHTKKNSGGHIMAINANILKLFINNIRFVVERLVIYLLSHCRRDNLFKVSIANTGTDISKHPLVANADIIHLHWINQGFLSLHDIKKLMQLKKPIVWTMHDMWPFTGICHYSWGCLNFQRKCGYCPFLEAKKEKDLSYCTLQKKIFLSTSKIHLVAVTSWLKNLADGSTIAKGLSTTVISNVIDTTLFKPADSVQARKKLLLPVDKKIVLMGAAKLNDPIKGFDYLRESLLLLKGKGENILLVLFGDIKNDPSFLLSLPVDYVYMGVLSNTEAIAQLYVAADVTVVPSRYETFGQTLIESMACGCPVVSFDNSGQTDIIDHKQNGYLAKYQDVEDLAEGMRWILQNEKKDQLFKACIEKVHTHYTESVIAEKYITLYNRLLNQTVS